MKCLAKLVLLCLVLACAPTFSPLAEATVSTTAPRNDYIGTNSTAVYSYTFKIFSATDLRVTTRNTSNVETALVYATDYTVTGVGTAAGGTITLTAGNLATDYALTIRFDRTPRQSTDLRNQGSFFPETHETKFDELTRYSQQIEDVVDRSIHLPETEVGTATATTLPSAGARASQFLSFDASGNVVMAAGTSANLGPVSSYIDTLLDDGDAATARATLGAPTLAEAGVQADNVFRITGSADATKKVALEVDGVTAATIRTLAVQDEDGTLALTSEFDYANLAGSSGRMPFAQGHLFGATISNNGTDATNDIDIAAGQCRDANNTVNMINAALTKKLDAAWAVGTNQGGRMSAAAIADGTYHVFVIQRPDTGVVDVGFDVSATAPTMPANYTKRRRIGSVIRSGGTILAFVQDGDLFLLGTSSVDVNAANPGSVAVTATMQVPNGINVLWRGLAVLTNNNSVASQAFVTDPSTADSAPDTTRCQVSVINVAGNQASASHLEIRTGTDRTLRYRLSVSNANTNMIMTTTGWTDTRGRLQ